MVVGSYVEEGAMREGRTPVGRCVDKSDECWAALCMMKTIPKWMTTVMSLGARRTDSGQKMDHRTKIAVVNAERSLEPLRVLFPDGINLSGLLT